MLDTQPELVSPDPSLASRVERRGGHPYRDLVQDAVELSRRLELRALRTTSTEQRKLLRLIASQQITIAQRLEGYGLKFYV
jgi:hypothetical protein